MAFPAQRNDRTALFERGYSREIDVTTGQIDEIGEIAERDEPCLVVVDRLIMRKNDNNTQTRLIGRPGTLLLGG